MAVQVGLAIGLLAGFGAHAFAPDSPAVEWLVGYVTRPAGSLYLRALLMAVVPLIVTSLMLAIGSLQQSREAGTVGIRTVSAFAALAVLGAFVGLCVGNVLLSRHPLAPEERAMLAAESAIGLAGRDSPRGDTRSFVDIVPANPFAAAAAGDLPALIVFTVVFAVAVSRLPRERSTPLIQIIRSIHDTATIMIRFALRLAPVGVAALTFSAAATLGPGLLERFGLYVIAVLAGLLVLHFGLFAPASILLGRVSPAVFLRASWLPMTTAFATGSSAATLPVNLRVARDVYSVPSSIAEFVLPLGATMSRAGTACYQAISVVFLAQAFEVPFGPSQQWIALALCSMTAMLAAGIPGGALPIFATLLPTLGIPAEGIGLIASVDSITGMIRTVPNVTGSLLVSTLMSAVHRRATGETVTEIAS